MKFLSFIYAGKQSFGVLKTDDTISNLSAIASQFDDLVHALRSVGPSALIEIATSAAPLISLSDVQLLPPIPRPGKIICVGLNFPRHVKDSGFEIPKFPSTFVRLTDSLVGSGGAIVLPPPSLSSCLDFEGELAVVIGKSGRHIPVDRALEHIFAYSCFNDGSVRDIQNLHALSAGKNFPSTGGFGPFLVTSDEIGNPSTLTLTTRLNGKVMQHDTLDHMIFSVPEIISYVSAITPLSPGDVLATGTPAGAGQSRKPPVWMREGDVVEVEISSVGVLRNIVATDT